MIGQAVLDINESDCGPIQMQVIQAVHINESDWKSVLDINESLIWQAVLASGYINESDWAIGSDINESDWASGSGYK